MDETPQVLNLQRMRVMALQPVVERAPRTVYVREHHPKHAKAREPKEKDLALQTSENSDLDADLQSRVQETSQPEASSVARVAELAPKLAHIEEQIELAQLKHRWLRMKAHQAWS